MRKKIQICYRENSDLSNLQTALKSILKLESLESYLDFELNDNVVIENGAPPSLKKGMIACGVFDFDDFINFLKERSVKHKIRHSEKLSGRYLQFNSEKLQIIESIITPSILYHYTSAEAAIKILTSSAIRFSPRSRFNDDFDTKFHPSYIIKEYDDHLLLQEIRKMRPPQFLRDFPPNKHFLRGNIDQYIEKFRAHLDEYLARVKILCLAENFGISSMWAHYADRHKGVVLALSTQPECNLDNGVFKSIEYRHVRYVPKERKHPVVFNEQRLAEFLVRVCEMEKEQGKGEKYTALEEWIKFSCVVSLIYTKSEDWHYEREWRCTKFLDEGGENYYRHENLPKTQFAEIILGHKIDPHDEWIIRKLVKDKGLDTRVFKVTECLPDFGYDKEELL